MSLSKIIWILIIIPLQFLNAQERTNPKNQDEELGKVAWLRDYDTALAMAKKQQKPVLILFQEVPGCATCRNYGHNVLSNPLMTEAIENEFIPLAIFNNKGGKDAKILKKYGERSWNNPVVRIVDVDGKDIVNRVARDYSAKGLYKAMTNAITKYGNEIPDYVKILGKELFAINNTKETYYSMYCFWTGEKLLGNNTGVVNTEAGFMNGREVVKVTYVPEIIPNNDLTNFALQHKMAPIKKDNSYRKATKDEDYYLQHSNYRFLPLSKLQRTKINSALGSNKNPERFLSPKQLKWLRNMNTIGKENRSQKNFKTTWNTLSSL